MKKKFISVMLAAAMVAGPAGRGSSGGASTGATTTDTQAAEAQKEKAKDDIKREDEKEDSEAFDSEGTSDFHIGIITDSVPQSEDDRRGAEAFQAIYGEDMIKLVIYSDNFTEGLETTAQTIIDLSDDPKMETIIMNQSVPGTTEAFHKIKEARPNILCITGKGYKDFPEIDSTADLVCNNDFVARGYLVARTAHELNRDTFIHTSFPRHTAYEAMSRRVVAMKEVCKEFGMEFILEITPDPTPDVGVADAQAYMLEKVPEWVEKYDKNTAYFCINNAHTEPLLKQLMEYDGYFVGADLPSPLMGYPGALGIDPAAETGDFDRIPAKIESIIVERGGADYFETWAYSYGYTTSAGLVRHALNVLNGENELDDIDDIAKAYQVFSPRAEWNGSSYTNIETGVKSNNMFLVYQDTYTMGDPGHSMGSTKTEVPEKYSTTK